MLELVQNLEITAKECDYIRQKLEDIEKIKAQESSKQDMLGAMDLFQNDYFFKKEPYKIEE